MDPDPAIQLCIWSTLDPALQPARTVESFKTPVPINLEDLALQPGRSSSMHYETSLGLTSHRDMK